MGTLNSTQLSFPPRLFGPFLCFGLPCHQVFGRLSNNFQLHLFFPQSCRDNSLFGMVLAGILLHLLHHSMCGETILCKNDFIISCTQLLCYLFCYFLCHQISVCFLLRVYPHLGFFLLRCWCWVVRLSGWVWCWLGQLLLLLYTIRGG